MRAPLLCNHMQSLVLNHYHCHYVNGYHHCNRAGPTPTHHILLITMTVPTPDALNQIIEVANTLYQLIEKRASIHLQLRILEQFIELDDEATLKLRILGQEIDENQAAVLEAVPILTALLEHYGYLNRGIATFAYDTPKHAVHPDWVEVYDIGLYYHESRTWDMSLGEVPAYALIHLEP